MGKAGESSEETNEGGGALVEMIDALIEMSAALDEIVDALSEMSRVLDESFAALIEKGDVLVELASPEQAIARVRRRVRLGDTMFRFPIFAGDSSADVLI